jgi:AcrR family transcriptional regulator
MPRKRAPFRFDDLIEAATDVFIREGFAKARMERVARLARSAAGTIYLYVEGKEALFDLALRRSLEDPTAMDLALPVPNPSRDELLERFGRCLHAVCHLPGLWMASEREGAQADPRELEALLRETWTWLARYRRVVLLVRASATDWPGLPQRFEREFTHETTRRWAMYLEHGLGRKTSRSQATASARFTLTTLAASALGTGLSGEVADGTPGAQDEAAAVEVLARGLGGRG